MDDADLPEAQRRLAAIMFTDMVGFTALTQSDEAQSLEVLERHNRLLRVLFPKFRGKELKTMGDSFLVEFDNALDAINCAIEIQTFLHDYNVSTKDNWKITLRIGIHLGDVVHKDGDVFGDVVNIASRLQPLAEREGVCISEQVYDQVRNKIDQTLIKLGTHDLKGIKFLVDVYKIVMPWERGAKSIVQTEKNRVAVLAFANMSPDPNDEYFADGMTDELIDKLAQVKGLEVIARTSVMSYKGEKKKAADIAKELSVGTLVEGSVKKAGNRVRVTAQLINGATEGHLWSSHYEGSLDDVFAIQSEIAEKIAGELKIQLLESEKSAIEKKPTKDTAAYTGYLQATQLVNRLEEEALRGALDFFQQAIDKDSSFAMAFAGMADCYFWLANRGYISVQEAIREGRAAAEKALELDSELAEAHCGMAEVMYLADNLRGSMNELRKAIELNPNLAAAYVLLADGSAALGDIGEMVRAAEKGYQLDPLSPWAIEWLGAAYFWTGRGEAAKEHWKKTLHLEPYRAYRSLFGYHVIRMEYVEAEMCVKELERLGPTLMSTYICRGYLSALMGDAKTAEEMIAKLVAGKGTGVSAAGFVYYALGDMDRFFEYELRAAGEHSLLAVDFRLNPLYEKARDDPRFGEVLKRSGLPY